MAQQVTIQLQAFNESCHSHSGALKETHYNYIEGCEILKKAQINDKITIFEVGFGLGLGLKATIEALKGLDTKLDFYSCEIDEQLAIYALESLNIEYKKVNDQNDLLTLEGHLEQTTVKILIGDVRETLPKALENNYISQPIWLQFDFSSHISLYIC